ncbi:Hypothetical predicted protein [Cloeon dipterum]|uniref:Helicase ATP-binding domain-containing protein n=1 Tax=Cloeon dipterum TaxID=197152 RepID=A0A8S1DPX0_9INSE|nr:Hypothetical predicted protein [Cloeon dipterum]
MCLRKFAAPLEFIVANIAALQLSQVQFAISVTRSESKSEHKMEPFKSLPELTIQKVFVPTGSGMGSASDVASDEEEDVSQVNSESEDADSESFEDKNELKERNEFSLAKNGVNKDEDEVEKQGGISGECKSSGNEEKVQVLENGSDVDEEIKSDVSPSLCKSIKKRKNSDLGKDTIKKKKRKRKREVKVKEEGNTDSESESGQKPKEQRPKNLRKNIREVMTEDVLDEETKAAQRQEMERLIRVQERQLELKRFMREQHRANMQQLGRLDNCVITPIDGNQNSFAVNNQLPSFRSLHSFENDPMYNTKGSLTKYVIEQLRMNRLADAKKSHPSVQLTNAVKHASATAAQKDPESIKPEEVTISSSDDDCMIVADSDVEEEVDDDPTNSGSHTNDKFNIPDEQGQVLINVHEFSKGEPGVFLAPQIARVIQPHQIGGIRFLYDNVIESLERCRTSEGFGCILAHSMGLGKTLQVVSFCDIFLRHTDGRRVLCVMPINTLQNWLAEFNLWVPEVVPANAVAGFRPREFKLHLLNDAQKTLVARAKVIRQWKADGGVLLIGYECYRNLCLRKDKKSSKKKFTPLVDVEESDVKKKLLWNEVYDTLVKPGPDLVICDEGHRIKNDHASISHALKTIQTKRRVVLTGYPLQNNLLEYWCMVDFVRPNYLGTKNEFSNMFERPIQNGQCMDSTPEDKRTMRYRAHVLHSLLNGFVQRRSHEVLQTALPPKTETVLLCRLSSYQGKLYSAFTGAYFKTKAMGNPLKAFSVCTKIWNHPDILHHHLTKNKTGNDSDLEDLIDGTIEGLAAPAQSGKRTRPKKTAKPVTEAKVDVVVKAIAPIQDASHSAQNQDFQFNQNLGYGESSNQYNQQLYQQQAYFNNSQQQCYQQSSNQVQAGAEHQEPYNSLAMGQSFQSQQQCWPQQGVYGQSQSSFGGQFDNSYGMLPTTLKPKNEAMMDMIDKKGEEIQSMEKMIDEKIENNTREEELKGSNMPKSGKEDSSSISYEWAAEIMKTYIPGLIEAGTKMQVVFCILEECSKINDRVLLFSQSLYTLNMIEDYLHKNLVPETNENWTKNVHYFRKICSLLKQNTQLS